MKCERCKEDKKEVEETIMIIKNDLKRVCYCKDCLLVEEIWGETMKIYKLLWNGIEQDKEFFSMEELERFTQILLLDELDKIGYRVYERWT